jgi:hypothetical protein
MPLSPYREVKQHPQLSSNSLQSPGRGSSRSIPNGSRHSIQQYNFDRSRIPQDFNGPSRGWTGDIIGEVIANVIVPSGPVGIPN